MFLQALQNLHHDADYESCRKRALPLAKDISCRIAPTLGYSQRRRHALDSDFTVFLVDALS